jgi:hypothetical protein
LRELEGILGALPQSAPVVDLPAKSRQLSHDLLGILLIIPQVVGLGRLIELLESGLAALEVKDAPGDRRFGSTGPEVLR